MDRGLSAEDEALQKFLGTTSFGKQARTANVQAQIDLTRRKPHNLSSGQIEKDPGPKLRLEYGSEDGEEEDEDEEEEDEDDEDEFPISHELVLKSHEKTITSVTLDPSGGRLVSSSTDCSFKLHDFASMTPTTLRSFKSVDPSVTKSTANSEAHPVHQVLFNPLLPSQILVTTAIPQAKIYDRDGDLLVEFAKGDMYLRDLNNTKGHISEVNCGAWNPSNRDLCVTAGMDSTLRIWDVNQKRGQKDVIVFKSKAAGAAGRTRMTAVAWGSQAQGGANILVSAALDGSLVMYSGDGPYHRPAGEIRDAHTRGTWTSSLAISSDGRMVVSRGGDDTVKLWDVRKFKQPVSSAEYASISSQYQTSNIQYSPNSSNIILGSGTGHLYILNPANLKSEVTTAVTPGSPLVTVLWHQKLNQIITGSANGEIHVLYNPDISTGGAKIVMSKAPKRRHIDDDPSRVMDLSQGISGDSIITPGAILPGSNSRATGSAARHPTIGLTASGKSRDPRRPHMPATTPFAKNEPTEKHIRDNVELSSMRDEDPREALLKYADKAPLYTKAWELTQPKTIYSEIPASDEEDGPEKKKAKYVP